VGQNYLPSWTPPFLCPSCYWTAPPPTGILRLQFNTSFLGATPCWFTNSWSWVVGWWFFLVVGWNEDRPLRSPPHAFFSRPRFLNCIPRAELSLELLTGRLLPLPFFSTVKTEIVISEVQKHPFPGSVHQRFLFLHWKIFAERSLPPLSQASSSPVSYFNIKNFGRLSTWRLMCQFPTQNLSGSKNFLTADTSPPIFLI